MTARDKLAAALRVAALVMLAAPAMAQEPVCGPTGALVDELRSQYGETEQSGGLTGSGALWATFANDETGTWTILEIAADGLACMVSFGGGFMGASPKPKGEPA